METFELRYFVTVARHENVHRAAEHLAISPGSLSKAISRLEEELGVKLFSRQGRNIRLTGEGRVLLARGSEILSLEEATRTELTGRQAEFQVRLAGPEILLAKFGPCLVQTIQKHSPGAHFSFTTASEEETERLIRQHEIHLGITTSPKGQDLASKNLFDTTFQTVVGRGHCLYKAATAEKTVPIGEVLKWSFVSSKQPLLGRTEGTQSVDGWRDDKFPRRIGFVTSSLQMVEELVVSGMALAYIPDYYAEQIPVAVLKISGCPYSCHQTVRLICKSPRQTQWLNRLFQDH